jgi:uncharacterized protein DUF2628
MRVWTAHLRAGTSPVMVREGFSWGALLFGPLWFAVHRAWIAAVLSLAAFVLVVLLTQGGVMAALLLGLAVLIGLSGHDIVRWSLDNRGYLLAQVVLARDELEALRQLLERRPDLKGSLLPPRGRG